MAGAFNHKLLTGSAFVAARMILLPHPECHSELRGKFDMGSLVSGHEFTRAVEPLKNAGFSPSARLHLPRICEKTKTRFHRKSSPVEGRHSVAQGGNPG